MNPTTTPPHRQTPQTAGPIHQTASEDAFHVPPIESPAAPDGLDMSKVQGGEAGHYGPAYGDPTRSRRRSAGPARRASAGIAARKSSTRSGLTAKRSPTAAMSSSR
jgi:hypothetical protein